MITDQQLEAMCEAHWDRHTVMNHWSSIPADWKQHERERMRAAVAALEKMKWETFAKRVGMAQGEKP